MFDLQKIQSITDVDSADCPIVNPVNDEPVLVLVLAGPSHPNRKKLKAKYDARLKGAFQRARDPQKVVQKQFVEMVGEDDESFEREIELLMAATLGWKSPDGSPAQTPYDPGAMESLYRDKEGKSWLRRQVFAHLADENRFTRTSQSN